MQTVAHPDLYDELDGDRNSHASPFARLMESDVEVGRLLQIGIRTENRHQQEQADRFGVEQIKMKDFDAQVASTLVRFEHPLYISIDLDVLDPAFAPGVSHLEPGGMSVRELLSVLHAVDAPKGVVGGDVVELNPDRDHNGLTGFVAAKLVVELAGVMGLNMRKIVAE